MNTTPRMMITTMASGHLFDNIQNYISEYFVFQNFRKPKWLFSKIQYISILSRQVIPLLPVFSVSFFSTPQQLFVIYRTYRHHSHQYHCHGLNHNCRNLHSMYYFATEMVLALRGTAETHS